MNAWSELKRILNEEKYISRSKLVNQVEDNIMIYHTTTYRYLDILTDAKYIQIEYKHLSKYHPITVPYYQLIRKIPEKLTIKDAEKMKRMPWLAWFKYPE